MACSDAVEYGRKRRKRAAKDAKGKQMSFGIRAATAADVGTVLRFIRDLAAYEKLSHVCVATEESLLATVFSANSNVKVLLLEERETSSGRGLAAGFAPKRGFAGAP
jgi:hypothetical protein